LKPYDNEEEDMNNNAKKWLRALRSGSYKQGVGGLHSIDQEGNSTFCCLGVACNLYLNEVGDLTTRNARGNDIETSVAYGEEYSYLPRQVAEWLGLWSYDGTFLDPENILLPEERSLADLNDNGTSFTDIAAVIEHRESALFRKWEPRSSSGGE